MTLVYILLCQFVGRLEVERFRRVWNNSIQHIVSINHNPVYEHVTLMRMTSQIIFVHLSSSCNELPVISVVIFGAGCGVFVIPDQPVEVLVTPDADCFHFFIRHITAICIEVPQNHDVLYGYAQCCFIYCYIHSCLTNFMHGISIQYVHP